MRIRSLRPALVWSVSGLALGFSTFQVPAQAGEPEEPSLLSAPAIPGAHFAERPLGLHALAEVGTVVGALGVAGTYSFVDEVAAGVGVGITGRGPQLGLFARWRPFMWNRAKRAMAITLTPGFSTGKCCVVAEDVAERPLQLGRPREGAPRPYLTAYWLRVDVAFEMLSARGFSLYAAPGVAVLLNPEDARCKPEPVTGSCEKPYPWFPTVTVSVGYAR